LAQNSWNLLIEGFYFWEQHKFWSQFVSWQFRS
jgi:hypothetical protein